MEWNLRTHFWFFLSFRCLSWCFPLRTIRLSLSHFFSFSKSDRGDTVSHFFLIVEFLKDPRFWEKLEMKKLRKSLTRRLSSGLSSLSSLSMTKNTSKIPTLAKCYICGLKNYDGRHRSCVECGITLCYSCTSAARILNHISHFQRDSQSHTITHRQREKVWKDWERTIYLWWQATRKKEKRKRFCNGI